MNLERLTRFLQEHLKVRKGLKRGRKPNSASKTTGASAAAPSRKRKKQKGGAKIQLKIQRKQQSLAFQLIQKCSVQGNYFVQTLASYDAGIRLPATLQWDGKYYPTKLPLELSERGNFFWKINLTFFS